MVQTVLIYSMGEVIGDGLIKLPFIAGLRAAFPDARISWCAAKGETVYAGPLKAVVAGYVDEVILDGRNGARPLDSLPWSKPFGGRKFDLVIDTQENLRRSLASRRAAAKGRFRFGRRPGAPTGLAAGRHRSPGAAAGPGDGRAGRAAPLALTDPDALAGRQGAAADRPEPMSASLPARAVRTSAGRWTAIWSWPGGSQASGCKPVFFFGPDEAADAEAARAARSRGAAARTRPHRRLPGGEGPAAGHRPGRTAERRGRQRRRPRPHAGRRRRAAAVAADRTIARP
jgi:hypothetical protein